MTSHGSPEGLDARILTATLATMGTIGYAATTVEDIIRTARISRRTFYERFSNKEGCFLAAFEHVVSEWRRRNAPSLQLWPTEQSGDRPTALRAMLAMLIEQARDDPEGARILFVEAWAAGPSSRRRAADVLDELSRVVARLLQGPGTTPQLPPLVALCVVGGLLELFANRCLDGRIEDLLELVDELADWIGTYPLAVAVDVLEHARSGLGDPDRIVAMSPTVHPLPLGYSTDAVATRRGNDPVQRILAAIPAAATETDVSDLSVNEIVRRAHVSQHTFREHFTSAEEAVSATALAAAHGARGYYTSYMLVASDWESSVVAALVALLRYFSVRPELGRFLYSYLVTDSGRRLRNVQIDFWAGTLLPGFRQFDSPHPIVAEGIGGGVFRAILQAFIKGSGAELGALGWPLVYFALVPFVGAARVVTIIERSTRLSPDGGPTLAHERLDRQVRREKHAKGCHASFSEPSG